MQNKKISILILIGTIIILGTFIFETYTKKNDANILIENLPIKKINSPKNATYIIENKEITLKDGESILPITPESATNITTKYFGNEIQYDLNNDGRPDSVFIITQNNGGSGTFYYVVAGINTENGYIGSHAILLGDRIAPQTTEISQDKSMKDVIVVNYADRKENEPFTTQPWVGKSMLLKFDTNTMKFGEVVRNFKGESSGDRMTIFMKDWKWLKTMYNDGVVTEPKTDVFVLKFKSDGTFSISTDCNGIGGEYNINGNKITFTKMMSTLMYCEDSQEQSFTKTINDVVSYVFNSKGELILNLNQDAGTIIFK